MATETEENSVHSLHILSKVRGVIFDMDGTLTVPFINFANMREQLGKLNPDGNPLTGDILEEIAAWDAPKQQLAFDILDKIEEVATINLALQPGALSLLLFLQSQGIRIGLLTRNTEKSITGFQSFLDDCVGKQHSSSLLEICIGRNSPMKPSGDLFPSKPSPVPFLHMCASWGLKPDEVIMVGDAPDDVLTGLNSKCAASVLLDSTPNSEGLNRCLKANAPPTLVCSSLMEFQNLFQLSLAQNN